VEPVDVLGAVAVTVITVAGQLNVAILIGLILGRFHRRRPMSLQVGGGLQMQARQTARRHRFYRRLLLLMLLQVLDDGPAWHAPPGPCRDPRRRCCFWCLSSAGCCRRDDRPLGPIASIASSVWQGFSR
jgi:hypothetical protein